MLHRGREMGPLRTSPLRMQQGISSVGGRSARCDNVRGLGDLCTVARPTSSSGDLPRPGLQIAVRPETSSKLSVLCARTAHSGRRLSSCLARAQPCTFRVDYKLDSVPGREFGSVFLASNENLALSVVAAGWAKARASQASL